MERNYWLEWENFLKQNGLKPVARDLLINSRSLIVLLSQLMVFGFPFFRSFTWGRGYEALAHTLGDQERIEEFADYLMEVGG